MKTRESYRDMRHRHELELCGWVTAAVHSAESVTSAAKRHGVNTGTMSKLWRRCRGRERVPPARPETYDELRERQEREVLEWMRRALAERGSLKQVSIQEDVNPGTLSRIAARLRDE